jgi:hypothetical protein
VRIVIFAFAASLAGCSFAAPSSGAKDAPAASDGRVLDAPPDTPPPVDAQISFVIEAEEATRRGNAASSTWAISTTPAGYTGAGSMMLQPGMPCVNPIADLCASLEFDVMIVEARTYHVFARMYASNGSEDSLHYAIDDDASATVLDTDENQPAWRWERGMARQLAPGLHTLKIWNRDSNLHLDAVALMPSTTPPP